MSLFRRIRVLFARALCALPCAYAQHITLDPRSLIGRWYRENGIYRFPIGTTLALKSQYAFGYGVRPVGIVRGYTESKGYLIEMASDVDADFFAWMHGAHIPDGRRAIAFEEHFKWNIEYHFRPVCERAPDLVYA